jgi:guanylate kinase
MKSRTLPDPLTPLSGKVQTRMQDPTRKGLLFVVSAPSGGGKTSLVANVLDTLPNLKRSISCTTRPPRPGEKDRVDYIFVERSEFDRLREEDRLLEWAEVYGNLYGTPKGPIEENRAKGVDTILAIEIQGARSVRQKFQEAITIFVQPPSIDTLEQRLRERASDPEEVIQKRLDLARSELKWIFEYDYTIVNDDLERASGDLRAIITAERCRVTTPRAEGNPP